ncbi:Vms1/Ankzf1 family peptidyl-tRNA hydrolase [Streptomyces sp. NPDC015501]|uniref:baeRF2 domain-containing protein n=1 Tax=unclassified Streptomyces TaxID=2593676 RepID=UPI0036FC4423
MDLSFLQPLYDTDAPVASVHLDTTRSSHDADKRIELGWRSARGSLAEQGADEEDLRVLDSVVGGVAEVPGPQGEALFASAGRLLGAFTLAEPPAADSARLLPVADPLGLAIDRDHQLPHVVVAVDRAGADVEAYPAAAHEPSFQRTFHGSTLHITRVKAGAEAQASFHRRSVNLWTDNTEQVAQDVRDAAAHVEAAVVLVAGDPKAVGLLRDHFAVRPPLGQLVYIGGGRTEASARESAGECGCRHPGGDDRPPPQCSGCSGREPRRRTCPAGHPSGEGSTGGGTSGGTAARRTPHLRPRSLRLPP